MGTRIQSHLLERSDLVENFTYSIKKVQKCNWTKNYKSEGRESRQFIVEEIIRKQIRVPLNKSARGDTLVPGQWPEAFNVDVF